MEVLENDETTFIAHVDDEEGTHNVTYISHVNHEEGTHNVTYMLHILNGSASESDSSVA